MPDWVILLAVPVGALVVIPFIVASFLRDVEAGTIRMVLAERRHRDLPWAWKVEGLSVRRSRCAHLPRCGRSRLLLSYLTIALQPSVRLVAAI